MDKSVAEKQFGFSLYQGGVVPGNSLRIVDIEGIDTEACCGTHVDNTSEIGFLKIVKTTRISDGVVRLYYVAGEKAMGELRDDSQLIFDMCKLWSVEKTQLVDTGKRFFQESKHYQNQVAKQTLKILDLQLKVALTSDANVLIYETEETAPTSYISFLPGYAHKLKETQKGVIYVTKTFIIGILGKPDALNLEELKQAVGASIKSSDQKTEVTFTQKDKKQNNKIVTKDILSFKILCENLNVEEIKSFLASKGCTNAE